MIGVKNDLHALRQTKILETAPIVCSILIGVTYFRSVGSPLLS